MKGGEELRVDSGLRQCLTPRSIKRSLDRDLETSGKRVSHYETVSITVAQAPVGGGATPRHVVLGYIKRVTGHELASRLVNKVPLRSPFPYLPPGSCLLWTVCNL